MSRQLQTTVFESALVAEPAKRFQPEPDQVVAAERVAAAEERLREPGIVVAELVLEPAPAFRSGAVVRVGELLGQALEQVPPAKVEPVGVKA